MKKQIKKKVFSLLAVLSMLVSMMTALPVVAENAGDFVISVEDGKAIITDFNKEYKGDVVIPSTLNGYPVTEIYANAFEGRNQITSVTIPSGVTSIGANSFIGCSNLTSVIIHEGITSIGDNAFRNCGRLEKMSLPKSLLSIGLRVIKYSNIKYVYYAGSIKDWEKISKGYDNSDFTTATIHYNSTMPNDTTVTPAPATAVPVTPAPATPVPATAVPSTPVPATQAPATVAPATPTPTATNTNTTTIINNNTTNTIVTNSTETNNNINNNTTTNNNITTNTNITNNITNNISLVLYIGKTTANVGGENVENDVAPIVRNDRTMLPARFVAEQLGAKVDWNQDLKQVIITKGDKVIIIPIGSDKAYINSESQALDSPAFVENDRTYTPVRFIAENLDADVQWNGNDQSVTITEK